MRVRPRSSAPVLLFSALLSAHTFSRAVAATPETRRAFTIEDLYRLKVVGAPVLSPDGKTIVYSVASRDLLAGKETENLWRVDPDGKNGRQLTFDDAKDSSPRFSPDGKTMAFVSTRSGDSQLFLLPMAGGEAEKVTSFPGGVGDPVFSPDGRRIAFTADVWPECGADEACNKRLDETKEKGKLKAYLADGLLYRHWTSWKGEKRSHILVLDLGKAKPEIRDVTPGANDSPDFALEGPAAYDFSPDGKELAFTSKRVKDPESSTNTDLWTVNVDGTPEELRAPRNLTASNMAWDGTPRYSRDGRFIYYRKQVVPAYESDRFRLAVLDRKTGESRTLTEGFDNWILDFALSADGKRIYFTAEVKGRTPLFELDLSNGKVRALTASGALDGWAVSADGAWAAVSRRRVGNPSEIWRLSFAPRVPEREERLTFHNAPVEKEVDIRPAEELSVPGADGTPIQVWLVKPHGFDPAKKYPLILNVHGGPQQQWADAFRGDWQVYPGAGYVVAFPNPHGSTGFGQKFTAAISADWDGKVMEDIAKVADHLAGLSFVDKDRMGAMGWSWGGYAMMWLEGHTTRFKALASMMGVYDLRAMYSATEELWFPHWDLAGAPWENPVLYKRMSPSEAVTSFATPCLVITGEKDFRVPYTQSLEFFTDLQKRGIPSRLIVFANAGHWPSWHEMSLYYAAHLDWFHRYLGGAKAPADPAEIVKRSGWPEPAGNR